METEFFKVRNELIPLRIYEKNKENSNWKDPVSIKSNLHFTYQEI